MARLIVKNLPGYITDGNLKEKFSNFGELTEVRLVKNSKGVFRRMAYIGFSSDVNNAVISALNGTYIDTCKISIDTALPVGDPNLQRSWSKYSMDSSANIKKETLDKKRKTFINEFYDGKPKRQIESVDSLILKSAKIDEKDYQLFRDFLHIHSAKIDLESLTKPTGTSTNTTPTVYTIFMSNLRTNTTVLKILHFFKGLRIFDVRLVTSGDNTRFIKAFVDFGDQESMAKALKFDSKPLKGTRVNIMASTTSIKETIKQNVDRPEFDVLDTGRIFIRNLPFCVSEEDLREKFEKFGHISEITIPYDSKTQKQYGLSYISFMFPENALQAIKEVDGTIFKGRIINVIASAEKYTHDIEAIGSFKIDRSNKLKNEAETNFKSWNSLFLNQNSVANLAADRLSVSKNTLLMDTLNPAVNIAAAETAIVNEIKNFLESKGVNLEAFRRTVKENSDRIILLKNLPEDVTVNYLTDFIKERFESADPKIDLPTVILPPHGITAILDFVDSKMASRGYKNLAFVKFKFLPLYLEWAPVGILTSRPITTDELSISNTPKYVIHISNLNQETTEDYLRRKFCRFGNIIAISISKKNAKASYGYGYIEYSKKSEAVEAVKKMQGKNIDGFDLKIKLANERNVQNQRIKNVASSDIPQQDIPKILVKNVPFEATLEDIHNLFKTYSEVKKVRLPKKMGNDSGHRGFAFIEFLSQEEAKRCYEAMSLSTHLYGRRLVLEWAKDVTSIEGLRKRTLTQFSHADKSSKRTQEDIKEYLNKEL